MPNLTETVKVSDERFIRWMRDNGLCNSSTPRATMKMYINDNGVLVHKFYTPEKRSPQYDDPDYIFL